MKKPITLAQRFERVYRFRVRAAEIMGSVVAGSESLGDLLDWAALSVPSVEQRLGGHFDLRVAFDASHGFHEEGPQVAVNWPSVGAVSAAGSVVAAETMRRASLLACELEAHCRNVPLLDADFAAWYEVTDIASTAAKAVREGSVTASKTPREAYLFVINEWLEEAQKS